LARFVPEIGFPAIARLSAFVVFGVSAPNVQPFLRVRRKPRTPNVLRNRGLYIGKQVKMASAGSVGGSVPPNGLRNPRSSDQSGKTKAPGFQDAKALELEGEFKTRHLGVVGVLAWIM